MICSKILRKLFVGFAIVNIIKDLKILRNRVPSFKPQLTVMFPHKQTMVKWYQIQGGSKGWIHPVHCS